jgi:hypothetical protein
MKVLFDELAHEVAQETILPYEVISRSEANNSSLQNASTCLVRQSFQILAFSLGYSYDTRNLLLQRKASSVAILRIS